MTRFSLLLMLGIAACGLTIAPAMAQRASVTAVSPPLSLEDFRRPIVCSGANFCAVISPDIGLTRYAPPVKRSPLRRAAAFLPGPTPRPEPSPLFQA